MNLTERLLQAEKRPVEPAWKRRAEAHVRTYGRWAAIKEVKPQ